MKTSIKLVACLCMPLISLAQGNAPKTPDGPAFAVDYDYPPNYSGPMLLNYVRSIEPVQPVNSDPSLNTLRSAGGKALERTVYSDGFLRPLQVVTKKHVNTYSKDLVQYYNYDASGAVTHHILPFAKNDRSVAQENLFDKKVFTNLQATYSGLGYDNENAFYEETLYERSLLMRATETRGAGYAWAGQEKGVRSNTRPGDNNDLVKKWKVGDAPGALPVSTSLYTGAELVVSMVTDEDGVVTKKYQDADGQVVAVENEGLRTYYVYDTYGRLRYVIPPKAANENMSQQLADDLFFSYTYDARGNQLTVKKPGIGHTEMRYDKFNRVVFSQDAVQRANGKWVFYKYDEGGRLIQQGIFAGMGSYNYPALPEQIAAIPPNQLHPLVHYIYNAQVYADNQYRYSFGETEFYVHYYFDNYNFIAQRLMIQLGTHTVNQLSFDEMIGNSTEGFDKTKSNHTRGLLTGVHSAVSDGSRWIVKVNYYNNRGELIQTLADDLEKQLSFTAMGYDFKGNLTKTVFQSPDATIQKKYTYDCYGRLRQILHKAGNATDYRKLARLEYDEIGRLQTKSLGAMNYAVKYEYNIRNWITGINKQYSRQAGPGLYFGEELFYEQGYDVNYLNGRLAGMQWRSKGSEEEARSYGYLYDNNQRLTTADYNSLIPDNSEWKKHNIDFTSDRITYDANGNLLTMRHMGADAGQNAIVLDDLEYTYEEGTNKLLQVSETAESKSTDPLQHDGLGDFRDVNNGDDYSYDANGNLAADANRSITTIGNNWFTINKPLQVELANGNKVTYIYDALGNLLRKKASWEDLAGDVMVMKTRSTDYVGELVYESDGTDRKPAMIMHDEGRIRISTSPEKVTTYQYDYYLKDHLDNIRAIITETATEGMLKEAFDPATFNPAELENPNPPALANDPAGYIATSEVSNAGWETQLFDRVNETRGTKPSISGSQLSPGTPDQYSADLRAAGTAALGPGKLIKVMAGDRIQLGAEAYFRSIQNPETPLPVNLLVGQVISALTGAAAASGEVAQVFSQSTLDAGNLAMGINSIQNNTPNDTTLPAAYLNYLVFDNKFKLLPAQSGAMQVAQANAWAGLEVPQFEIAQNGYIYVFTSNQSHMSVNTDNLYVYHWSGALLEEFHYYPFGLTFGRGTQAGLKSSDVRYNSQSMEQNEFTSNSEQYGLNWYDFMARSYDVQLGRWMQPDPMMQHASPYLAMSNNPTLFTDPDGLYDTDCPDCPKTGRDFEDRKSSDGLDYTFMEGRWHRSVKVEANKPYASLAFDNISGGNGDFERQPIYQEEGTLQMHSTIIAHNKQVAEQEARRAAMNAFMRSEYRSYGWSDAQNRAAAKFMLTMAIPYGGILRGVAGVLRLGVLASKIGSISIPVYRVYGGSAYAFGKSWSLINPKLYGSTYRFFGGIPNANTMQFMARGTTELRNIQWIRPAVPIFKEGSFGHFVPEVLLKNPSKVELLYLGF